MTLVGMYLKGLFSKNFIFMSLVALIFGLFSIYGNRETNLLGFTYEAFYFKGLGFLFIVFSVELSKGLLQREKLTRRTEWMLGNGVKVPSPIIVHGIILFIGTFLLLFPLILLSVIMMSINSACIILEFYVFGFLWCILLQGLILWIRNMNHFKSLSLILSFFYLLLLTGEMIGRASGLSLMALFLIKISVVMLTITLIIFRLNKERIVSSYY